MLIQSLKPINFLLICGLNAAKNNESRWKKYDYGSFPGDKTVCTEKDRFHLTAAAFQIGK